MKFRKTKDGNLILTVVTDRKLNLLSETIEETDKVIDMAPATMRLADEFIRLYKKEAM